MIIFTLVHVLISLAGIFSGLIVLFGLLTAKRLDVKIPALHSLAPTQTEPPFKIAQLVVPVFFVMLTILAAFRFRPEPALEISPA